METVKNKKTQHIVIPWTTGLAQFPVPGGVEDQPMITMIFFEQFMAEERAEAQRKLSK